MEKENIILKLMALSLERKASDIHLQTGSHPALRIKGEIVRLEDFPVLDVETMQGIISFILKEEKDRENLERKGSIDTSLGVHNIGRFRINIFKQRGSLSLVARRISNVIPDFHTLNLPPSVSKISQFPNGLVLVTGPTGTGKSSTLAAVINDINKNRQCHILCIEDPIEYLYKNERAIITQREIGIDVDSFREALKYAVRQDPDVILVGEIRDSDTVEFALQAAETGHLVFGTLHSSNVSLTISRILNFFPQERHLQVRRALSMHLRAVISQLLLPSINPEIHLIPACEIMFVSPLISRLIMEGKDDKIIKAIKAGKAEGMQDFEDALIELVHKNLIDEETALKYAENPHSLDMKLKGIYLSEEGGIVT
ncbi:MAG TPA: PilT/PilU family type 4a pilus ATPase [bacterium]|nr:PilT/PilU family type 4a pilus ATPase [bacterium]HPP29848.1 PilT/PilU family type 4a pilus ATPase [bacterium]